MHETQFACLFLRNSRNSDLSVSLNDDDILAEFTKPRLTSSKDAPGTEYVPNKMLTVFVKANS